MNKSSAPSDKAFIRLMDIFNGVFHGDDMVTAGGVDAVKDGGEGGGVVHEDVLGTAEGQVLRVFVERPNQILTREQLVGHHDLSPLDRSIDVRISRLRRRLEHDLENPKLIKTVYGAGYLFSALVHWT